MGWNAVQRVDHNDVADWRRWRRILLQSGRDFLSSDGLVLAGSLAFYTLLSLFPLIIAAVIVASYLTDPRWVADRLVEGINEFIPNSQLDAAALLDGAVSERARLGIIAVVVVVITGRRVLGTLILAFNRMSDVDQADDPLRRRALVEVGLVVGLAVLAAMSIVTRPLLATVEQTLRLGVLGDDGIEVVILEAIQALLILGTFMLVYAIVPLGKRVWRAVLIGSLVTTVVFLAIRAAFQLVVNLIWDSLATLYGPFASTVFLLTWLYWVAVVILFGAALTSHIKVMAFEGSSDAETARRHVAHVDGPDAPHRNEPSPGD